jgi:hypothetical protein
LNERGIESPGGGRWHAPWLLKAAVRLGLREKAEQYILLAEASNEDL